MARKNKALGEIETMKKVIETELNAANAARQSLEAQLNTLTRLEARIVNEGFKFKPKHKVRAVGEKEAGVKNPNQLPLP